MKKLFVKFGLVLGLFLMVTQSYSSEVVPLTVNLTTSAASKKLVVNMSKMYGEHVTCTILDQVGNVIHREIIDVTDEFSKKYDMSKLAPGQYSLIVDDLMSVETLNFKLTSKEIIYNTGKSEIVYKPRVVVKDDNMVYLNLLALGKDVRITVLDDQNSLYTESFSGQSSISRRYNFNDSPSGNYVIKVQVDKEVFYTNISI